MPGSGALLIFRGALEDDVSLAEFVALFPGVSVKQAGLVFEHVARSTAAAAA
jgi:hypothetical protein